MSNNYLDMLAVKKEAQGTAFQANCHYLASKEKQKGT